MGGVAHIDGLSREGNIVDTQTIEPISHVRVFTSNRHAACSPYVPAGNICVYMADADWVGRARNVIDTQTVDAIGEVGVVARHGDAFRIAAVRNLADADGVG